MKGKLVHITAGLSEEKKKFDLVYFESYKFWMANLFSSEDSNITKKKKNILTTIERCCKFFRLRNKLLKLFVDSRGDGKQFAQMFSMET